MLLCIGVYPSMHVGCVCGYVERMCNNAAKYRHWLARKAVCVTWSSPWVGNHRENYIENAYKLYLCMNPKWQFDWNSIHSYLWNVGFFTYKFTLDTIILIGGPINHIFRLNKIFLNPILFLFWIECWKPPSGLFLPSSCWGDLTSLFVLVTNVSSTESGENSKMPALSQEQDVRENLPIGTSIPVTTF